jgi:hypothetical protein
MRGALTTPSAKRAEANCSRYEGSRKKSAIKRLKVVA